MSQPIDVTSVPPWAIKPTVGQIDTAAAAISIFALDAAADTIAETWREAYAGPVRLHRGLDGQSATAVFDADREHARVGWRVMIAGPLVDVLALRAHALASDLDDDEIVVATTTTDECRVACSHCSSSVIAQARIGDVIECENCGRNLLIYYHVSRRQGAFLGFMVDAEVWEAS